MTQHNGPAIRLVADRYSAHVKRFNALDVSEADSDEQFRLYKELGALATAVLTRAPLVKPSGNRVALLPAADLGNVYQAMRHTFTPEERDRYNAIQDALNNLSDKYED